MNLTVIKWRDIPTQVMIKKKQTGGRKNTAK